MDLPQPGLAEASDECIPLGRNVYVFGDEMSFITGECYMFYILVDDAVKLQKFLVGRYRYYFTYFEVPSTSKVG